MKVLFPTNFIPGRMRSLTASLLCVTLLLSDLPAHAQTPAQLLPQNPVLIPAEYGRVEEVRQAGSKTIFFLQDAHDSLEAQENIASLIHHLVETSGVKTVFEEGYEGPVPADDYFGPLKDSEVREKVSYYLLDQLRIGGAEYAHINRKRPFKLMGGDNAELHRENIAWYRKTAEYQEEASQGLRVLQQEIARLADRNFPAELKEWMKLKTRFDQGKISFWDYLQRLREPGEVFFHEGLPTEAMNSRYPVLSSLYRAAMKDLPQELQDGDVNAEVLFRETSDFENDIADTLITLERDRQTFKFYKTLELLLRLNSLEVSFDEYQALRGTLPETATEDFARFISRHAKRSVSLSKRWEENVRNAMQFYETAGERDRAVEKKLIEFKADTKEPSAVLVFGGFHRSAIREILRRQGFSYQIISPVISETQEKHRERYRNLMSADYETRFVPASVSAAARALSDIAVAELSPVYKKRFAEELDVLSRAAMDARGGPGGDVLLGMQQELKKQPVTLRSELRAQGSFQRGERLTQEKLEEEVRKLGETSLEVGGNDRTGWAVSTEKRYEHDRLHALESALSKRFKGYRFSYYYDVRTDQDFKRLDILPPLSRRSELRPEMKSADPEVLLREPTEPQAEASGISGRSELRGMSGSFLGAAFFENPLWLLVVPPVLAAAVYFLYQAYHFWISKRVASALSLGARYIARGSYTHVLKHAGFPGYVILVKRHPLVMRLKQGEAIRSPQVTEDEEWKAYKALKKIGLAPFTRYAGKFLMKNMKPDWAGAEGEDVFRADQKKLAELYGKVSSSMRGVSVYLQEEGVPLNQFVRENPDQKSLADKSLASFTLKLWKAGWIDLDIGRRNYLLVTDREGRPVKTPEGLFRLKAHDFGAIMPIPEDLERFMLSKHMDSDVTRGFFLLRNLTATVRAAAVLFPRLELKRFHEISKAADEAAERMKARGDKAAFRSAYLGVIESPENKKVITELSIDAARMIRKAVAGDARSELRAEDAGESKERKRLKQRVRAEAEKRVLAARKVFRTRIIFIGFASAALFAGAAVYWMLPNVPAQPEAAAPSEAVIERQRFATIRGISITDSTRDILSQQPELIDAIAEGYDAADRVRKSQIASYEMSEGQAPVEEGQTPGVVFQVQPHTPLDVAPPFEPVQIRRDAAGRLSPVDLQGVRTSVSGGRIQTVEQVREWMAWLPLAAVGLMAVLAYAFLKGVRRVDTGSIMDVKSASDRSARDISKLRAAAEEKKKESGGGGGRSELRIFPEEETVNRAADVLLKFIGQQSGEKLSKMGYRFTIVPDVEQVTMRNLLLNFWPEVTALIGSDNPEVWFENLEGINEGMRGRAVLERIRPLFLAMSRFGRHADEGQEDFRLELQRVFEKKSAEENPEPVRIFVAGPGYLQEAVEVLAAADASMEALDDTAESKLRLEVIVADLPGELSERYQSNNLVYHSRDVSFLPEAVRDRYLEAVPGGYRIRPEAHERLSFRFLDLNRHRDYGLLGLKRGSVDFVLNHNLEPYMKPRAVRRFSEYLHAAMRDEGVMYARLTSAHFDRSSFGLNGPVYWLGDLFEYGMGLGDKSQYPREIYHKFHKKGHSPYTSRFGRDDWLSRIYEEETARENALDSEDEGWLDRVLGPARSELRSAGKEDTSRKLKATLLGLMTVEGASARNKIFNDAADRLKGASPSVKGRFKKLLLELLDNRLEGRALREIGSPERETSAGQRAVYRRLYEHLYDERGRLRKDIMKLETAPSAAVTLKYEETFTVRAGRRKETLRVERVTSLSQSDWSQIFEIYAPHNLREFHRDLMSGRRNLSGKENAVFVVRTSENKIAGFSWAFADPAKRMLGLAVSAVAKPYRGKGLAARLLISRLEWGMSNGLTYARTHVGASGRVSGWHWRLLSLGGRIDSLSLQSPLPEIGIRPEDQSAADQAIRAAQSKPYPQSRKPVESVLKKHPDADVVVTFDLSSRLLGSMKGKVLAENLRSELRASEPGSWETLKEQMDHLLRLYPTEEGESFYDLTDEKGFFRALRELLRQYQKAEVSLRTVQPDARNQFEAFQKSLEALLGRIELLLDEDYSKLTEFHPGAAAATFGVMAVQIKPEILQDETPRQFFFGLFSLKQLTKSGVLKVDLFDGAVVSPLPEVKGVLADRYPEVMREKLEKIQKLTVSFLEDFQDSRSELRTGETNLQHFVSSIISSHRWPDIIEVDIDSSLRIKETSTSHLGFAIFELVKNAIDGNRVYEKKSGTDSRPDVRLTAAKKDGWIEFRIMNRGVLAVDKLRAQAREDGVWKLRPSTPDKHLWPYLYIMESRMPEEPMPYQRMRPEEVDALADEDLLFHVKGLTLRSDANLRRIGLMRSDLTGGMGLGLKLVWQEMKTVDPERPVHYETSEIDGTPWVTFSVRLPEAAPRSELRNLEGPAPALETADFFLKRLGPLSGISSAAYSRLDLNPEGQRFFFETLKTTLAASFGEGMNGFTEKDVARTAYAVRDDKSGVPLGVLYQFGNLPIFFDFIELTKPPTEAALLNRDHAGAWAAADQAARRVYQKKLGQVHFLERLTLAGLSSESSRWLTEHERLHEKVSSGLLSLFVISEIQDWSRKADIFLRPDQVGSLDFQQALFRINRQRPEFFKSVLGITGFGTGVDSLLAIRYGAEAIHGTEPYALVRLLGELNIRYARESGQISAELPVTVEMTKGLSKDSAVKTWLFNTPLVVKNGTRSTFMPANVHLPIALLPSTGSLYLEESEFQAILKEAAAMLAGQPGKRAVMRVDGDSFAAAKEDMTAYLESVRIYLEKQGLSLTGYYGGAFVEFQAAAYGLAGKEQYLKSAFKILEEDGQPSVPAEALLWFIRQLESAAVTAADGGTVSRDTLEAWKKKLLENPARSELRTPSDAEYIQIAAEAERLRELVEDHSLLRNKPDGTGKSDIVKALAEARDLSRERGDIERIVEIVKRANGWYPGRVNTNYFQFDDRNIKKQLAAFSRSVQKTLRDSNAGRSELRMFINDLVRQQFVIAGVPFLDEHIPTDKGVFRPTLSGLVDPLAEYAGHYEPVRVIDLGSGQGAMVFAFARANDRAEVLGIEYDEQLFNDSVKVRDSFFEDTRKRIRLERGDFNDPRFAEEIQKADLVNYWETGARAEGTMLLNLAKNMRAGARFLVTKNSGRFIRAVKDTGYFDLAEEALDDGIFLFKRNEKPFEALAAAKPEDRSELRMSGSGEFSLSPAVEKMTVPAAVFLDARELPQLKAGQADERFDELLTFLERHPAFDLYIDHGDQYPLHNLELPKLRQILSEFPGRVHFGEHSRANLAKKKILLQVSFFEDAGSFAETRKLIQDIQRRYRIQSDLLPVEYLLPGSLKGFLGLAESFTQAEMIREIGEAYATRSTGGRWRLAADFAASLWARIQNDYAIQWSA